MSADETVLELMSLAGKFTLTEDAAQNLDIVQPFTDAEIEALGTLDPATKLRILSRLGEIAESLRESLYALEGRLLQLGLPMLSSERGS